MVLQAGQLPRAVGGLPRLRAGGRAAVRAHARQSRASRAQEGPAGLAAKVAHRAGSSADQPVLPADAVQVRDAQGAV